MGRERSLSWVVVGALALVMLVPGLAAGSAVGGPAPLAPSGPVAAHPAKDPIAVTNWAGYGVRGAANFVPAVIGSWIQPVVTCPATGLASEAIGVGLDAFPLGGKIDGAGTVVVCVYGTPDDFIWYDEPQTGSPVPAVLVPAVFAPGNTFIVNVSCSGGTCGYFLKDISTAFVFTMTWSYTHLPLNFGECVVMRGTSLGLPAVFRPIPTTPGNPTQLTGPVEFGSHYTGASGCWIANAAGALMGLSPPPAFPPGYVAFTFKMNNAPPAGNLIVPTPLVPGITGLFDSFVVP